jgi:hypothetical protein
MGYGNKFYIQFLETGSGIRLWERVLGLGYGNRFWDWVIETGCRITAYNTL